MGYGLGLGFRMMEFNAGFKRLDVDEVSFKEIFKSDAANGSYR